MFTISFPVWLDREIIVRLTRTFSSHCQIERRGEQLVMLGTLAFLRFTNTAAWPYLTWEGSDAWLKWGFRGRV